MAPPVLILDNSKDVVKYHFDQFVRPRLTADVALDVARDAEAAESLIRRNDYAIAIVESIIQPKPLVLGEVRTRDGQIAKPAGLWARLFGRKDPTPVSVSIEGLTGRSVSDIIRLAADFLPSYAALRPDLKFIVVCHQRGGLAKEEKARLTGCSGVIGLFGWLSTEATAKKVARLVSGSVARS